MDKVKVLRPVAGTFFCYKVGEYNVPGQMSEETAKDLVRGGNALDISVYTEKATVQNTEKRKK